MTPEQDHGETSMRERQRQGKAFGERMRKEDEYVRDINRTLNQQERARIRRRKRKAEIIPGVTLAPRIGWYRPDEAES